MEDEQGTRTTWTLAPAGPRFGVWWDGRLLSSDDVLRRLNDESTPPDDVARLGVRWWTYLRDLWGAHRFDAELRRLCRGDQVGWRPLRRLLYRLAPDWQPAPSVPDPVTVEERQLWRRPSAPPPTDQLVGDLIAAPGAPQRSVVELVAI